MSNSETHFELQGRKGSSWTIIEVFDDQDEALERAKRIWDSAQYEGIKLTKESFNQATNLFICRQLFHRGEEKTVSKFAQSKNVVPCSSVDSLYNGTGRYTIWEIMFTTLQDAALTPTELLYNRKHYDRLHKHGGKVLGAVQRVASVGGSDKSIHKRILKLWEVIDEAVTRVSNVESMVPALEMGRLLPIIQQLEDHPRKKFLLTKSIVDYIAPAVTMEDKFGRVAIFLNGKRPDWAMAILDQLISEMLRHKGVLSMIFPNNPSGKQVCIYLIDLFRGQLMPEIEKFDEEEDTEKDKDMDVVDESSSDEDDEGERVGLQLPRSEAAIAAEEEAAALKLQKMAERTARVAEVMKRRKEAEELFTPEILRLSDLVREGRLPMCTSVLYDRITQYLDSGEPLEGKSLTEEFIAIKAVLEKSKDLPLGDADRIEIGNLCERRVGRHLTGGDITNYLGADMNIFNRMNRLIDLEELIPTDEHKRVVAGFIGPIFELPENEKLLTEVDEIFLEKMQRITRLQSRILRSSIEDPQRTILSERLDSSCRTLIENSRMLEELCNFPMSIGRKGVRLLQLINAGHFTKGHCLELVNIQLYAWLKEDNFLESYTKEVPKASKEQVLAGLMSMVNKAQYGMTNPVPRKYPPLPDMEQ